MPPYASPDTPYPTIEPADLDVVPIERAETLPARWYREPAFEPLERDAVFARTWQHVGHASQLPDAGHHITAMVAGKPVVVVRDGDGGLHAFYNVCRHRGGPLALKDGHASMLKCRYHGWTYRLDGSLRGVPHFNRSDLFDKKDYGLVPLRLAEWQGLLFVHLAEDPAPHADFVQGIDQRVAPAGLDSLRYSSHVEYTARCNWKVYVDNYLEGYHVPHVHPELCSLYDFQAYRTEVADWFSLQVGPLSGAETPYGVSHGEALYYFLYPNCMLNILPGRLQTNVVLPEGPDRCRIIFRYYYADTDSDAARKVIAGDLAFSGDVQAEDIEICERVQEGLGSGVYDRGRFSPDMETAVHHFQSLIKRSFRETIS
jgi:choline monooxygenase